MLVEFKNLLSHMQSGDSGFQKFQSIENLEQVKVQLESIQTSSPKLFMNNVPEMVRILELFEQEVQTSQAYFFLEVLTNNVETCSDIYQKEGIQLIIRICVYLCKRICSVLDEGTSTFLNLDFEEKYPDLEKFELENPSSALVVRFVELFGRLVSSVDFSKFMQNIKNEIFRLSELGDWRLKSAALILFGEFHEIGDFKEITDVFAYLINNTVNSDLRVRYYAAYSIGVAYSNFKKKFEKKYLAQLIPIVASGLESDADIVSCQWIWLFIVMAESSPKDPVFREYIDKIIDRVCQLINLNNQYITEKCLESLQSLTLIPRSLSKVRIEKYLEICHTILTSESLQINNYIIERCCICMTSVLSESNPMTAVNYIEAVAENIWKFSNDMGINYYNLCWQDLCACGVATVNWSFMFEKVLLSLENSQLKNIDINNAFKSIVDTVDFYRLEFVPFSHRTLQLLFKSFKNDFENDSPLCDFDMFSLALQKLVEFAKPTENLQKWENDIGEILRFIISKTIEFEFDELYDLKLSLLELLKVLLKEYGRLLRSSEIDNLIEKLWKLSNFLTNERNIHINLDSKEEFNSDSNNQTVEAPIFSNNEDENEGSDWDDLESSSVYGTERFFVSINECLTKIPDIFQVLFEYVNDKAQLIHHQWEEVERKLAGNIDFWDLMYVGHFVCSFIEYYSYEFLKEKWNYFNSFIEQFILHENPEMRQIIIFTLGLFIQKTPEDLVSLELVSHWIELTKQCFLIGKSKEVYDNSYDLCQDNCISTLGKIIFKFGEKYSLIEVYPSWLAKLPLKFDEIENTIQITNIHTMLTTPSAFSQTLNLESMFLLLKAFASLKSELDEKQKTQEVLKIYNLTKLSVQSILKKEMFIENQISLLGELNDVEKEDLNVLMSEY